MSVLVMTDTSADDNGEAWEQPNIAQRVDECSTTHAAVPLEFAEMSWVVNSYGAHADALHPINVLLGLNRDGQGKVLTLWRCRNSRLTRATCGVARLCSKHSTVEGSCLDIRCPSVHLPQSQESSYRHDGTCPHHDTAKNCRLVARILEHAFSSRRL